MNKQYIRTEITNKLKECLQMAYLTGKNNIIITDISLETLEIIVSALENQIEPDNAASDILPESWKSSVMKSFMETE